MTKIIVQIVMLLILYSCSKSDENQNYEEIPLVSVYLEGFPLNKL